MIKIKIIVVFFTSLLSIASFANEAEVMTPIHTLFDGMREADGDKVRSVFADEALFFRAHAELRKGRTVEEFATAVEQNKGDIWDEKIWGVDIKIEGKLASVWTNFAFYLGDTLSHCGVNSFQLYHFDDGWKIIYLVDTYQNQDCKEKPD